MKRKNIIILYSLLALALAFFWCFEQVPSLLEGISAPEVQHESSALRAHSLSIDTDTVLHQNPSVSVNRQLQEYTGVSGQMFMLLSACVTAALFLISSSISMWLEARKSVLSTFLGGKSPPIL